jgi:hypothetical protein
MMIATTTNAMIDAMLVYWSIGLSRTAWCLNGLATCYLNDETIEETDDRHNPPPRGRTPQSQPEAQPTRGTTAHPHDATMAHGGSRPMAG